MPEATDDALIAAYLAGDPRAFDQLVNRHQRRIYNLCYRMLGRTEDARDVAQEVFLTALRKLPSFRGDAAFATWLHRVAVNACYDALRRRQRQPDPVELSEDPTSNDRVHGSLDPADVAADVIDVQRALTHVPEDFRSVLILHDAQDVAYEDIARILDIPLGTVKSRLHRGRVSLAEALRGTSGPAEASEGIQR